MIDPFRSELTARYSIRENLDWAAQERLARQVRPSIVRPLRSAFSLDRSSFFSRLARVYAHA